MSIHQFPIESCCQPLLRPPTALQAHWMHPWPRERLTVDLVTVQRRPGTQSLCRNWSSGSLMFSPNLRQDHLRQVAGWMKIEATSTKGWLPSPEPLHFPCDTVPSPRVCQGDQEGLALANLEPSPLEVLRLVMSKRNKGSRDG